MTKPRIRLRASGTFYFLAFKWIRRRGGPVEEVWVGPYTRGEDAFWAACGWRDR